MIFQKEKIIKYSVGITVLLAVFYLGFYFGKSQLFYFVPQPSNLNFSLFWDAYNKLGENLVDPSQIDNQKVLYGAIRGMTKSLGDPYTDFFDPAQAKLFAQDLQGSFDGIGVEVGLKKDQLTVIAPLKGTPGEKAGLQPGDIIVKVDGQSTSDMSIDEAVNLIRGKKGTQVTLTIFRDGWSQTKDTKIIRDTIKVNPVSWELKDGDVAYIKIDQFDQSLPDNFKVVANQILYSPAKKIVLDLRNDPGGYLDVCQEIAGWFLKPDQVVTIEYFGKGKDQQQYKTDGNGAFADYPIVVLINKGSASAAEILAGALRDDRNIQLVGEQSFGKGSVQEVLSLADGQSLLKITIAKWLTPKGNSISEVGLAPDVKVEQTEDDISANNDPQLRKALEIIQGLK